MAGHSHWANIKRKKEKEDKKKSMQFTRAAKQILSAIREGGPNPDTNSALRAAIEFALSVHMPKDNISRLIKKAKGELDSGRLHSGVYEAYGPGKVPLLIEVVTDNINRTVNDLRSTLAEFGGSLADKGAVMWRFKEYGAIKFKPEKDAVKINKDECMLEILYIGEVYDVIFNDLCIVLLDKKDVASMAEKIEKLGYKILFAGRTFWQDGSGEIPKEKRESFSQLLEALEEIREVQNIWW